MPIFEYRCPDCGKVFDEWVPTWENEVKMKCPACGKEGAEKQVSGLHTTMDSPSASSSRPGFFR